MLAQQVSKLMPWLVGMALVSALGGAVLATDGNNTYCSQALIGGANLSPDCVKWTGCKVSPPGTCEYGGKSVGPLGGNQAAERDYELCLSTPNNGTKCENDDTESVCLSYQGYIQDTMCMQGPTCLVQVLKQDCHTSF